MSGEAKKWIFIGITILIFAYVISTIQVQLGAAVDDIRLALSIIMFVWILNWMRNLLGSPRLALLFALVVAYLIFFKHPTILFTLFGMMLLVYFIKPFMEKATDTGKPETKQLMEFWKEILKSANTQIVVSPSPWPYYYPPSPPKEGEKK